MTVMWVRMGEGKKSDSSNLDFCFSEKFSSCHWNSNVCLTDVNLQGCTPTPSTSIRRSTGVFRRREEQAFKQYWISFFLLLSALLKMIKCSQQNVNDEANI